MGQLNTIELITPIVVDWSYDEGVKESETYTVIDGDVVGNKYIRIISLCVNNFHASENLEFYVLIGGEKASQIIIIPPATSVNVLALGTDKEISGTGGDFQHEVITDAIGNYFLEHNGSVDLELEFVSESAPHDAVIQCKYTYYSE